MTNTYSEYKRTCTCTGKVHWRDTNCHQSEKPPVAGEKCEHEWKVYLSYENYAVCSKCRLHDWSDNILEKHSTAEIVCLLDKHVCEKVHKNHLPLLQATPTRYECTCTENEICWRCGEKSSDISPQPEQWSEELEMYKKSATEAIMTFDPKHTFCTICGTDPEALVARLNEVVASLLLAQKEQMLEVTRGMKKTEQENNEYAEYTQAGYNRALSDVEEKLKKL